MLRILHNIKIRVRNWFYSAIEKRYGFEEFHWYGLYDTEPTEALRRLARLRSNPGPDLYPKPDYKREESEPYQGDIYWLQAYFIMNPSVYRELYIDGYIQRYINERSANTMHVLTNNLDLFDFDAGIDYRYPGVLATSWITPLTCQELLSRLLTLPRAQVSMRQHRVLYDLIQDVIMGAEYRNLYRELLAAAHHMGKLPTLAARVVTRRQDDLLAALEEYLANSVSTELRQSVNAQIDEYNQEWSAFQAVVRDYQIEIIYNCQGPRLGIDTCQAVLDGLAAAISRTELPCSRYAIALLELLQEVISQSDHSTPDDFAQFYAQTVDVSYRMHCIEPLLWRSHQHTNDKLLAAIVSYLAHTAHAQNVAERVWADVCNKEPHFFKLHGDRGGLDSGICVQDMWEYFNFMGAEDVYTELGFVANHYEHPIDDPKYPKAWETAIDSSGKVNLLFSAYDVGGICNMNFPCKKSGYLKKLQRNCPRDGFGDLTLEFLYSWGSLETMEIYNFIKVSADIIPQSPKMCALVRWYMITHGKQAEYFFRGTHEDAGLQIQLNHIFTPQGLNFIWLANNNVDLIDFDAGIELFDEHESLYTTIQPSSIIQFCSRVEKLGVLEQYESTLRYLSRLAVLRGDKAAVSRLESLGRTAVSRQSVPRGRNSPRLYNPHKALFQSNASTENWADDVIIKGSTARTAKVVAMPC